MDKESAYLRQKLDCNCNDCAFMVRDFDALENAKQVAEAGNLALFKKWQRRKMQQAWDVNNKQNQTPEQQEKNHERCSDLIKEVKKRKFIYSHDSGILYGKCEKLNKQITFIPNVCQLETQECFLHRKDKNL